MNAGTGENTAGAAIAALIFFFGNVNTLLMQEGVVNLADISQAAWFSVCSGALVAFLKDYHSLAVRRWSARSILKTDTVYPKERFPKAYGLDDTAGDDTSP